MAAKAKPRERFNLPTLVLDSRPLRALDGDPLDVVFSESGSSAPLRVLPERRSDVGFVGGLHEVLCAEGLAPSVANHALNHVINRPGLAIRRHERDPRRASILQAVAVDDQAGLGRGVIVTTATVLADKPPRVEEAGVEFLMVEWDDIDDLCALSAQLEVWWREYELRSVEQPFADAPETCGWLGGVDARAYRGVPPDWESQITALSASLGLRLLVARTAQEFAAQSLQERVDLAVVINGYSGWDRPVTVLEDADVEMLAVGSPGQDFAGLLGEARRALIPYVLDCIRPEVPEPRELLPGEVVYHRKVPPQPRGFDRFDTGSAQPCQHGADSFEPWRGDKAVKGMQRLYANFEPKMLHHCSKFPKCKMYAAKG